MEVLNSKQKGGNIAWTEYLVVNVTNKKEEENGKESDSITDNTNKSKNHVQIGESLDLWNHYTNITTVCMMRYRTMNQEEQKKMEISEKESATKIFWNN